MLESQREFIEFALEHRILRFGEFTLKSGRRSPYFFNAGLFATGRTLNRIGRSYARVIMDAGLRFDMLFGPAYKGIPLVCATAMALAEDHGRDVPWAFNRKEVKSHGEGGRVIGTPLHGHVLVIDDVLSAGTSVRESRDLIESNHAQLAGVAIVLDRQERGQGSHTAAVEIQERYQVPVVSIVTLDTLVDFLVEQGGHAEELTAMQAYRKVYGVGR